MFLNRFLILIILLLSVVVFGQENQQKKDSIKSNLLDEVVVTGQLRPQSVKKSVFEVKVITAKEIKQRAGNNLADVLNQTLNVSIYPSSSNGKSQINVLGLGGRYFKVLVDNIPLVNEEGFGNNTDLTTINLDDIERIEFVEGAMGVQYGANAMSGILNIITKKESRTKWNINAFLQEETVGNEYELFNKGRHIQGVSIGHQLTQKDYLNISINRNDFRGYLDTLKGKTHLKKDFFRGYTWLPKKQINTKLLYSYKGEKLTAFYKFDYVNEHIFYFNKNVELNNNAVFDINNPSSLDREYINNRYVHHLNFNGFINKLNYNVSFSYQKQEKKLNEFTYFIQEDKRTNEDETVFLSKEVWFSRGTLNNIVNTPKFSMQAGYEITSESGYGSSLATLSNLSSFSFNNSLTSYDFFTSGEINFNEKFSVKPGVRASFTNSFNTLMYYSASARHLFKNNWEARAVLGFGETSPTYDQLYTYLVDANHDIQGNRNLNSESGMSVFFHLKKNSQLNNNFRIKNKLTFSYLDVKDRIQLTVVNETPLAYQYANIDDFSSLGISFENDFWYKNLTMSLGGSVFGINRMLSTSQKNSKDRRFTHQINANATYAISSFDASISAFFKYVGSTNRYVLVNGFYELQEINPYSLLEISARKQFLNKKIEATFGVRNLLNITSVGTNGVSGGAHSGTTNSVNLNYGRSYFLKLAYNFKM